MTLWIQEYGTGGTTGRLQRHLLIGLERMANNPNHRDAVINHSMNKIVLDRVVNDRNSMFSHVYIVPGFCRGLFLQHGIRCLQMITQLFSGIRNNPIFDS